MAERFDCTLNPRQCRDKLRGWLRLARRGNAEAFAALAAPYLDLVTEYLVLCGVYDGREMRTKIRDVLNEAWRFLPFTNKVSDFERLVATVLFSVRLRENPSPRTGIARRLTELDPRGKFAFLARDFEDWDYPSTATTLRITRKELGDILLAVRCRLLEVDLEQLDKRSSFCIRRLSMDFDDRNGPREKKKLSSELVQLPAAKEFKTRWLDFRCHLIEFRQQIRLSDEDKCELLEKLSIELQAAEMIQVPLLERLVHRLTTRQTAVSAL